MDATCSLDASPRPTAARFADFGVRIAALNRSPRRIAYIGFDNLGFTDLVRPVPALVTQPMSEYGRLAAEKLLARIRGDRAPFRTVRLPADFSAGDTV